ncbi:MAG: hypothetical protein KAS80_02915, partial [Anaerolineales bacterium]|nr:hypothetical protein [Anaerolineales bacterium]
QACHSERPLGAKNLVQTYKITMAGRDTSSLHPPDLSREVSLSLWGETPDRGDDNAARVRSGYGFTMKRGYPSCQQ